AGLDAADMSLYAAAARRSLGLVRTASGEELVREGEAWIADQKVRRPDRLCRVLAPGPWTLSETDRHATNHR
ncbi:MAG: hypothetical protein KDD47_24320, partial [Acidobacteria bacterium]|nr:hypothetical protein [Acidobacteriota bacterium]